MIMNRLLLTKYHGNFVKALMAYFDMTSAKQTDVARMVGIEDSNFSALISGERKLSANYLEPFFIKGILMVDEIRGDLTPDSDREEKFWHDMENVTLKEIREHLLALRRRKGLDLNGLLAELKRQEETQNAIDALKR